MQYPLKNNVLLYIAENLADCVFSYKIDKMGHIFRGDYLPAGWVKDIIKNYGVNYMYSDSDKINSNEEILQYVEKTILEVEGIRVFKLKLHKNKERRVY